MLRRSRVKRLRSRSAESDGRRIVSTALFARSQCDSLKTSDSFGLAVGNLALGAVDDNGFDSEFGQLLHDELRAPPLEPGHGEEHGNARRVQERKRFPHLDHGARADSISEHGLKSGSRLEDAEAVAGACPKDAQQVMRLVAVKRHGHAGREVAVGAVESLVHLAEMVAGCWPKAKGIPLG